MEEELKPIKWFVVNLACFFSKCTISCGRDLVINCHPMFVLIKLPFQGTFDQEILIFCDIIDTTLLHNISWWDRTKCWSRDHLKDGLAGDKARWVKKDKIFFLGRFLQSFLLDGDHNHQRVVGFMERFRGVSAIETNVKTYFTLNQKVSFSHLHCLRRVWSTC